MDFASAFLTPATVDRETPVAGARPTPAPRDRELPVVIVGGGFSGTLMAINLLQAGARVVLVERAHDKLARGVAFGTPLSDHLLNVRAANMGAYPHDPGHFLRWVGGQDGDQANRFVPRQQYGQYLREELLGAMAVRPDRLRVREDEAVAVSWHDDHAVVTMASGETVVARSVVLALGNFAPAPVPALAELSAPVLVANPWAGGALDDLAGVDHVLLLGTGLTAVDVALSLDRAGYRGQITAVSRRGLAPRAHADVGPVAGTIPRPETRGSWLLREVRRRAEAVGWRQAVDELRPHTQSLWRLHDTAAQARFLRHARPWWDVHRHRLAPAVAARIAGMRADGRLHFAAGRLVSARPDGAGAQVEWRARGADATQALHAGRVILCTGPSGQIDQAHDPLLASLVGQGRLRADIHGLGVDVDHLGRVFDADGRAQPRLLAVGPITRGEAWEINAVPDIRRQVWELARWLTDSHWVSGEGL